MRVAQILAAAALFCALASSSSQASAEDSPAMAAAKSTYGVLITPRDPDTSAGTKAGTEAWNHDLRIKQVIYIDDGKGFSMRW